MTMADTVAVMNAGRIEQLGAPQELYDLPRTPFVANFLGRSNLIPGTVVEEHDGLLGIDTAGTRVLVPAQRAVTRTGSVLVGIRPEKMTLLPAGHDAPPATTTLGPGTVADVSFTGVSTEYLVDIPGTGRMSVFAQNLTGVSAALGDQVRLAWSPEHAFALVGEPETALAPEPVTAGAGAG